MFAAQGLSAIHARRSESMQDKRRAALGRIVRGNVLWLACGQNQELARVEGHVLWPKEMGRR